jgi:hypothetical protein
MFSRDQLKRAAQPKEIAEVVAFLASEKSSFIVMADGGMSVIIQSRAEKPTQQFSDCEALVASGFSQLINVKITRYGYISQKIH